MKTTTVFCAVLESYIIRRTASETSGFTIGLQKQNKEDGHGYQGFTIELNGQNLSQNLA